MYFATDIANFLACPHISTLKREETEGLIAKAVYADPGAELLRKLGLDHELKYLDELKARGLKIVEIATEVGSPVEANGGATKPQRVPWSEAAAATREAMQQGADVIYQATFVQSPWAGRADFLVRVEAPSNLGAWSYEVVETKLAKSTKARALIQLCFYSELVDAVQGKLPERMHVVLGKAAERSSNTLNESDGAYGEEFFVQRYIAYFRKIRREFQAAQQALPVTYPEPVEHCAVCDWFSHCDDRRHADDHLSLVAGITRNQRKALVEREVSSVAKLASLSLPVKPKIDRVRPAPLFRIREQARVQVRGREERKPVHELIEPVELGRGLAALPWPSPGDLFLDFEGDPFAFEQGLEYLIGTVRERDAETRGRAEMETRGVGDAAIQKTLFEDTVEELIYDAIWSFNPAEEKKAFQTFIGRVMVRRRQYPDMHVYHYAPYEPTAIKHLAGRHGVCTDEVDVLLRAEVFVDLFRVVRQGVRASVESYSIKKMEAFYGFTRTVPLRDATSSLQAFEAVLALGDNPEDTAEILKTIADYNCDDCLSTWQLREWLEGLRGELEARLGEAIPRPELKSGAPNENLAAELTEIAILKERLVAGLPAEESEWTNEQRASWLLAQLLEWHRREDKSMWWEYYRLCELSDDELIEDKNALGGLEYVGVVQEIKRSEIHRYRFPVQDHTIDRALEMHDPCTQDSVGTLFGIDELNLTIDLKRGKGSVKRHPTALIAHDYVDSKKQVASLMRLAKWVVENGIEGGGEFQSARDALLRRDPRIRGTSMEAASADGSLLDAAGRIGLALESSILPIQGPPGSGKTFTGAQMIIELVNAGKRVGITAGSHKVISNLLSAVCEGAGNRGVKLSIVQKPNELDGCEHEFVTHTEDNAVVLQKLQNGEALIAAGTAWLWSREEMMGSVDVLFVDEAGQMSLANVLAVSPAAKSLVLLGDPQQLDQPQKGVHPPGAEVSALAHLLDGRATIEPQQGLFLSESWRLHPDICSFTSEAFYDGRLQARAENSAQRLNTSGLLDGTGLRFVPVRHFGNQSDSPEEVEAIAEMVEALLITQATWTNKKGDTRALTLNDILIVAPYNAQVALLARRLPDGARVGTVDKFQGQEAPIVFYSMTTSTPEDAPRGMEFLYSSHRLNVATSRAQCVTVLVASPSLFDVQCKTPRQMQLANAFCKYLELAQVV